jgi:hypothetical protein
MRYTNFTLSIRDLFLGWYKDEETMIQWDFEIDKVPEKVYVDGVYQFVETKLYAKWGS